MTQRDLRPRSASATPDARKPRPALSPEGFREDAHAVVIGINHYDDPRIPDLRFAVADAQRFHDVLTDPTLGRFRPENVSLLLDGDATERRIRSAIGTDLPKRASADHTVCVFFAGHGAPVINARTGSSDGLEKYLLPHDALATDLRSSAIPMDDVNKFFDWIDTSQVIFFIDSCYSGVAGGRTFGPADYTMRAAVTDEFLDSLAGEGRLVVTACATNEVALEREDIGHGLFTYHLIEGLKGHADSNQDGLVTLDELYDYVYRNVEHQARTMGGSMNPLRKGFVKGSVYLAQYETPSARRVRAGLVSAELAFGQGDHDAAERSWRDVLEIDGANDTALRGLETIDQRRAEEKAELDRIARLRAETLRKRQRVLLEYKKSGALSMAMFAQGMAVIAKSEEELNATERMLVEFTDALIDGGLNIVQYIQSVELLTGDATAGSEAPSPPIAAETREVESAPPIQPETGIPDTSASTDAVRVPPDDPAEKTANQPSHIRTENESAHPGTADTTSDADDTHVRVQRPERFDPPVPDSPLAPVAEFPDPLGALPRQPRRTAKGRRVVLILSVAEVAVGVILLVIGSLELQRSQPRHAATSLVPEQTAVIELALAGVRDVSPITGVARALTDLERALEGLPGIASAGVTSISPFGDWKPDTIALSGPNGWTDIEARRAIVTPDYFETIGVALVSGRTFHEADTSVRSGRRVAVISEGMANGFWTGRDVIGVTFRYGETGTGEMPGNVRPAELTIVGVVSESAAVSVPGGGAPIFYVPYTQEPVAGSVYLIIRSSEPTVDLSDGEGVGNLASDVRAEIQKVFPGAAVGSWMSNGGETSNRPGSKLFLSALLGLLGAIALLHAARKMLGVWRLHRRPDGQSR
jgi:hypothetical protein